MFSFFKLPQSLSATLAPSNLVMPVDLFRLSGEMTMLLLEAQTVVMFRLLGMSGFWAVMPSENRRMVREKPAAFARSANAALEAAMDGKSPDKVVSAAIRPLRTRTRSNVERLSKRGPKLPLS